MNTGVGAWVRIPKSEKPQPRTPGGGATGARHMVGAATYVARNWPMSRRRLLDGLERPAPLERSLGVGVGTLRRLVAHDLPRGHVGFRAPALLDRAGFASRTDPLDIDFLTADRRRVVDRERDATSARSMTT